MNTWVPSGRCFLLALAISHTFRYVLASQLFDGQVRACGEHRLLGLTPTSSSLPSTHLPSEPHGPAHLPPSPHWSRPPPSKPHCHWLAAQNWSSWELKQELVPVPLPGTLAVVRVLVIHRWSHRVLTAWDPLRLSSACVSWGSFQEWKGRGGES